MKRPETFRHLDAGELGWIDRHSSCPYCGGPFIEGPRGGMNVNVFCANVAGCDSRFNLAIYAGEVVMGEFVGACPKPLRSDKPWTKPKAS